ncbi:hypothetical protein ACWCQR_22135, partial [Streptomyces sp. NPDC002172]
MATIQAIQAIRVSSRDEFSSPKATGAAWTTVQRTGGSVVDQPDNVNVVIHNYRHRLAAAPDDP